jgi:hypothetical protein
MSEKKKSEHQGESPLAVGSKVYFRFGNKTRLVRVIEDRGKIGRDGRRLLRVAFMSTHGVPVDVFEIPADDVIQQRRRTDSKIAVG